METPVSITPSDPAPKPNQAQFINRPASGIQERIAKMGGVPIIGAGYIIF